MGGMPPAYLEHLDPRSLGAIEWALYCSLMCSCDKCDLTFDIPHWGDPPWNGDVKAWAQEWAPKLQEMGWSMSDDCFNLRCSNCRPAGQGTQ
jgi:hypothetical protein